MALSSGSDKNQQSISLVVAPDGDPGLEGSQRSSPSSYASDQAWYRHHTPFPTQDNETRILGEESD